MSGAAPPSKKEQIQRLLKHGSVFVHLDPRREGVVVPQWLADQPQLVLQLGLNFAIPIPDLEIDDLGVRCTLSFNRTPFQCELPWAAIYALVADDGQVTLWPTELPAELASQQAPVRKNPPSPRAQRPRASAPPKPRVSMVPSIEDGARPLPPPPSIAPSRVPSIAPSRVPSIAPEPALGSPSENRAIRGNDSVTVLPPKPEDPEPRSPPRRSLPPYLRVVK